MQGEYEGPLPGRQKKGGSVLTVLTNATKMAEIGYLFNASIFVRRNPDVPVPYGTTANEAAHARLKGSFWNVKRCTKTYVRSLCTSFTTRNLLHQYMDRLWGRTSATGETSNGLMHVTLAVFQREPKPILPAIGDSQAPKLKKRRTE